MADEDVWRRQALVLEGLPEFLDDCRAVARVLGLLAVAISGTVIGEDRRIVSQRVNHLVPASHRCPQAVFEDDADVRARIFDGQRFDLSACDHIDAGGGGGGGYRSRHRQAAQQEEHGNDVLATGFRLRGQRIDGIA